MAEQAEDRSTDSISIRALNVNILSKAEASFVLGIER
jgi:hypothetical protein